MGTQDTIFGTKATKVEKSSLYKFQEEAAIYDDKRLFEQDLNVTFRMLEDQYSGSEIPDLHICFLDIEVDFHPSKGYSTIEDPFSPITSITMYLDWVDKLITLAVPPPTLEIYEAAEECKDIENMMLFNDEKELLEAFLDLIDDVDVYTGWNSTFYDIPYIIGRIEYVMGREEVKRMCLWNLAPRKRTFTKFKKKQFTYDTVGMVHLDYLELYQKHSEGERHSYSLDFIGQYEVKERKTPYDGTLDTLYKNDFRQFIEYNRQDVMIIVKIDKKLRYINLSNLVAHANTVLLNTTLGSVALIEQAIINEAHRRGQVVPNRIKDQEEESFPVAGGYVAVPKMGLHDWVGIIDLKSLYPSIIRALNMGPETLFGQLRPTRTTDFINRRVEEMGNPAAAWRNVFAVLEYDDVIAKNNEDMILDLVDGTECSFKAHELYDLIFENDLCISANGTLFRTDVNGIIPDLLERWYKERQEMQAKKDEYSILEDNENDPDKKAEYTRQKDFWDQRQYARKILLNSLYGALLNEGCRFFDQRLGQSVTLTAKSITKHMNSSVNEVITGKYDHTGDAIVYGDTDSSIFSAHHAMKRGALSENIVWNKENVIEFYDNVAKEMNKTFIGMMAEKFHVDEKRGSIIRASREICASRGLFSTKKRYAILMYDEDGLRVDSDGVGQLKIKGMDSRRSDSSVFIQKFLNDMILNILKGSEGGGSHRNDKRFQR